MESVLQGIKEFGRETAASNRELVRAMTLEEFERAKAELRDRLLDAPGPGIALDKVTELMTREIAAETAVAIWEIARQRFHEMLKEWVNVPKVDDPTVDGIVEHLYKVYGDLAAKADSEYRAYAETAHLLKSPANAKRLKKALEETRSGKLPVFASVEEA